MTNPTLDIDQLRRQFPVEVVRYFESIVSALEGRIAAMEEALPGIAADAASAAEQEFEQRALGDIVEALQPEIDEYIAEGVIDERTGERYKFYIDTQANIEALTDREDNVLYIGKEEEQQSS